MSDLVPCLALLALDETGYVCGGVLGIGPRPFCMLSKNPATEQCPQLRVLVIGTQWDSGNLLVLFFITIVR